VRLLGILITACIILAAAQAMAVVLCVLLVAALIYGLFVCPREMLGMIGLLLVAGMWQAYPLAFLGLVALIAVVRLLTRSR
jgi:quinol-cytochrome oxidoreductase complex cytochrome b subunit